MTTAGENTAPVDLAEVEKQFPGLVDAVKRAVASDIANESGPVHDAMREVESRRGEKALVALQAVNDFYSTSGSAGQVWEPAASGIGGATEGLEAIGIPAGALVMIGGKRFALAERTTVLGMPKDVADMRCRKPDFWDSQDPGT